MPLIRLLRALWLRTGTCPPPRDGEAAQRQHGESERAGDNCRSRSRTCSLRSGRRRDLRPDDEQHLPERVDPVPGTPLPGARQQMAERDRGGQPRRQVYPEDAPGIRSAAPGHRRAPAREPAPPRLSRPRCPPTRAGRHPGWPGHRAHRVGNPRNPSGRLRAPSWQRLAPAATRPRLSGVPPTGRAERGSARRGSTWHGSAGYFRSGAFEPCARPNPHSRRQRTEPAHMRSPACLH